MASVAEPSELAPVDTVLACAILKDLEQHLKLSKLASLKSEEHFYTEKKAIDNAEVNDTFGKMGAPEDTALEAQLQYLKLSEICMEGTSQAVVLQNSRDEDEDRQKLIQGMNYIIDVVHRTKESLQDTNNFSILEEETSTTFQHLNREFLLKSSIEEAEHRISIIKEEYQKAKQEASLEEQRKTGQITLLKDQHHLISCDGRESIKVADMYFDAQSCNMSCNHRNEMDVKTKEIHQVKGQIDRDIHCLAVMESWTDDFCQQLEHKIDEWKLKFRRDEFAMEMRIEAKQRAIKAQEELIKSLNETIAERLEELAPWEEEKEVERQERLAHMRRYYSTRKIQRWWRAYMIKWKLYRRKRIKPKA
ncbi:unnamed protein product [Orchesella dallaii]|uniref:IQ domain-containing protein G n=1 Tax=Orchesella dallaii TaxID=48710 RepID=A0ABP1R549_9HEXA